MAFKIRVKPEWIVVAHVLPVFHATTAFKIKAKQV
jgi:hypothetical protein